MAAANFERAFALTLKHEGGYVDHPRDPGGATNLGVTIGTLSKWLARPASKAEVRALTPAAVKPIYRRNFWDRIRGDELPPGVDYAAYDFAVNSGPTRGAEHLQRAIGATADGVVGSRTVAAASALPLEQTVTRICDSRMAFLRGLSIFKTFGRGWTTRVDGVRREARTMIRTTAWPTAAITSAPLPPPDPMAPMTGTPLVLTGATQASLPLTPAGPVINKIPPALSPVADASIPQRPPAKPSGLGNWLATKLTGWL